MVIIIVTIFGLIIGSFLNVVIFRLVPHRTCSSAGLHSGKSFLFGRSACPDCNKELRAQDLIPLLSFLFLKGRCRYCSSKISWQYPIVELTAALTFVLFAFNYGLRITDYGFWAQAVFACFFIVIAVYDYRHYLILDKVILPAGVLALVYQLWQNNLPWALLGALIISGFFALQYFASKGRLIGFGDVKLGIALGLVFAQSSLWFLVFAYFVGAAAGLLLLAFGKKQLGSRVPFGTILGFCAIIFMLYGNVLVKAYLNLLGF